MNFKDLCNQRYSSRSYIDKPIEADKLEYIKECARLAPSAVNFQPWRLRLITAKEDLARLCTCYKREWLQTVPAIIIISAVRDEAWTRRLDGKYHGDIDAAIVTEHICLAATEQGLATCWVCNFDAARCHELFSLPENEEAVVLLPIGYAADARPEKTRKQTEEIWIN